MIPTDTESAAGSPSPLSSHKEKKKHSRLRIFLSVFLILAAVLAASCGIYLGTYSHADASALRLITSPEEGVTVTQEDGYTVFAPSDGSADTGLIFYPGGKVGYNSYAPLLSKCAQEGILCVLIHMPGNLAVLDIQAADGIPQLFPGVTHWYIGGHSLGGAMAAFYVSSHTSEYEGLILLAAYSTKDLHDSGLEVLSVYGSEDGVMNRTRYDADRANLPENTTEIIIAGGCHGYFGDYGEQKGDGTPTITREAQTEQTTEAIAEFTDNNH